jgi:hypothetical protein
LSEFGKVEVQRSSDNSFGKEADDRAIDGNPGLEDLQKVVDRIQTSNWGSTHKVSYMKQSGTF